MLPKFTCAKGPLGKENLYGRSRHCVLAGEKGFSPVWRPGDKQGSSSVQSPGILISICESMIEVQLVMLPSPADEEPRGLYTADEKSWCWYSTSEVLAQDGPLLWICFLIRPFLRPMMFLLVPQYRPFVCRLCVCPSVHMFVCSFVRPALSVYLSSVFLSIFRLSVRSSIRLSVISSVVYLSVCPSSACLCIRPLSSVCSSVNSFMHYLVGGKSKREEWCTIWGEEECDVLLVRMKTVREG